MKIATKIGLFLMLLAVIAVPATADYLDITTVRINGDRAEDGDNLFVQRGETLNIRVTVEANDSDVRNAQIQSMIAGYRYSHYERDMVMDFTRTFDLPQNRLRSFDMQVKIPEDIQQKDALLRIIVSDENSPNLITYNYQLSIHGIAEERAIQLREFLVSPSDVVEAGRALDFRLRVKNIGNYDLDDVTARVAIPELNIRTHETIDLLREDETQTFEALLLRIPANTPSGTYEVVTTVSFDRFEEVQQRSTIEVLGREDTTQPSDDGRSIVTIPQQVSIEAGAGDVTYPVLIENQASSSKTYVLSTSDISSWGRATFEPSSVVVIPAGSIETVYLKLSAKSDAPSGDQVFQVRVESGDEVRTASAVAKVEASSATTTDLRSILEWSLVALIVLLIILGLILIFTRMRGKEDDSDEETQTYY